MKKTDISLHAANSNDINSKKQLQAVKFVPLFHFHKYTSKMYIHDKVVNLAGSYWEQSFKQNCCLK